MRAVQNASFDKTCTITRYTRSTTSAGGQSATNSTASTTCRLRPGGAPTRGNEGGKITDKMHYTIVLPYNTSISAGDDITIGSQVFRVVGFPDDHSFMSALVVRAIEK
jgi:hypothetical protein